jgi:ADP-ribose pyrophosphatase
VREVVAAQVTTGDGTTGDGTTGERHEFRTVSSRDVYVGRVMALRVDEVAMPGGATAVREVVEHRGAVVVAPLGRRLWELPAGLLDVDGEEPLAAAQRELAEEVGLAAARWSVLVDVAASPGFSDEVARVFLATELSTVDRGVIEDNEESDLVVRRIPLAEAVRWALAGELVNASTVAGVLAAHALLSGAAPARPVDAPWPDRPTRFAARRQ